MKHASWSRSSVIPTPGETALETRRFVLRAFREADRAAFLACQADPVFARFHTDEERQEGHADAVFDLFLDWQSADPRRNIQLAVAARSEPSHYLGTVGVRTLGLDPGRGDVGIELVPALWGQGAATEILAAFLPLARDRLGVTELRAETAPGNRAAERLAEAAGLQLVGENGKRRWLRRGG